MTFELLCDQLFSFLLIAFDICRYGNLIHHEEDYRWPILRKMMHPVLFLLFNFSFIAWYQVSMHFYAFVSFIEWYYIFLLYFSIEHTAVPHCRSCLWGHERRSWTKSSRLDVGYNVFVFMQHIFVYAGVVLSFHLKGREYSFLFFFGLAIDICSVLLMKHLQFHSI